MPKQSLNEVRSSQPESRRGNKRAARCSTNSNWKQASEKINKKQTVAATCSVPAFFEDHTYYHYYNNNEDDQSQDRKLGLFRNRLFSTWTGVNTKGEPKGACPPDGTEAKCARKRTASEEEEEREDEDVDGGYAWVILIIMFVINASTFGTARAYGLIFENSARRDEQSRSEAALPFTIMGAVENMAGPLTGYLLARTKSWRLVVFCGSCLITTSHLLAAWFDSQLGQILTIGLMCGIGQSFISISSFQINNAFFVRYRSRAFGIGLTGAAIGTFYISPLCQFVLDNHTKSLCYLMLGLILLPNVPLSLLLKLKETSPTSAHPSGNGENNNNNNNNSDSSSSGDDSESIAGADRKLIHPKPEVAGSTLTSAVAAIVAAESTATITTTAPSGKISQAEAAAAAKKELSVFAISEQLMRRQKQEDNSRQRKKDAALKKAEEGFWLKVRLVLAEPLFHLIWPTQLLFCWLNFVFGMIITDFGKDRGLNDTQNSHLIVIWASGQLFGRLCLGSLVDLRVLSYKSFTMVCFGAISLITFLLNSYGIVDQSAPANGELASNLICLLVFILSMFISTLYILFNGLVVNYMDKSLTALSIGISSFTGSFFLLPRANIIGYYRDTHGNYDSMLTMFTCVTMVSALVWLIVPFLCSLYEQRRRRHRQRRTSCSTKLDRTTGIAREVNELLSDCSLSNQTISIGKPDVTRQLRITRTNDDGDDEEHFCHKLLQQSPVSNFHEDNLQTAR